MLSLTLSSLSSSQLSFFTLLGIEPSIHSLEPREQVHSCSSGICGGVGAILFVDGGGLKLLDEPDRDIIPKKMLRNVNGGMTDMF